MKSNALFILLFALNISFAQEIANKDNLKKCRKELSKKECLSDGDGDGVLFYLDNCPKLAGASENFGCPWPDTDGDEIVDKDDVCPALAGLPENNGCPWQDTDGDGILDKDDRCPTVPGIPEKQGCYGPITYTEKEIQIYQKQMLENQKIVDFTKMSDLILKKINKELIEKSISYLAKKDHENKRIIFLIIRTETGAICGNETRYSTNKLSDNLENSIFWNEENLLLFLNFFKSYKIVPVKVKSGMGESGITLYTSEELKKVLNFSTIPYEIGTEENSKLRFVVFNAKNPDTKISLKKKYLLMELEIIMRPNDKKYRVTINNDFQHIPYFNLKYIDGEFIEISDNEFLNLK